jgi:hypothetical protein
MKTKRKTKKRRPVLRWYARGGGVVRMGPFATQSEASAALRLGGNDEAPRFPADAFVWSEVSS